MSVRELRGKRCIVTGAASGIGRATAVAAARAGAAVVLTDIDADGLAATSERIGAQGGPVLHSAAADVSDYDAVRALAEEVHAAHGSMDVVMNVAGISTWGRVEQLEHRHWSRQIEVNLMGPIHVIECFVPPMIEAGRGGHLVNVASAAALFGFPWHAPYCASKFGLRGVSEVLRFDLERHGIGVSLVCPGGVDTGLVKTVDIVGVDRSNPRIAKQIKLFQRHAITPEKAAAAILDGVRRGRYWVYTSPDIRVVFWTKRRFARPYEMALRFAARQSARRVGA